MSSGVAMRTALLVAATVLLTLGASEAAARVSEESWARAGIALAVTLPLALLIAYPSIRRYTDVLRAVEDGLISLGEKDFSVRIASTRNDEIGGIVRRFNELGAKMRAEHNDVYQKEILLGTVLEAAPMAIVLCNESGRALLGNAAARELLAEGRRVEGHALGDLVASLPAPLRDALGSREDALVTVERSTGAETWHVATRVFALSTQRHTLYILRDLGRELDRQEAETWKRAIRVVSHEVNNSLAPITSLTHSARVITKGSEAGEKLGKVFDTIEERTRHLQAFLESYARFARLAKPAPQEASWQALFDGTQSLYPFRIAGAPSGPGWFDPVQMQQVLINLLKNASESGSAPGEITAGVTHDGDADLLTIRDRGKGMTEETLQKALLPFYSTKRSGTGLGLSLCREIVEAHGGRIAIRLRDGGGVEVECRIPRAREKNGPPSS